MPRRSSIVTSGHADTVRILAEAGRSIASIARELGLPAHAVRRYVRLYRNAARTPATAAQRGATGAAAAPPAPPDALGVFRRAFGREPLDWQVPLLTETVDTLILKGRQVGASTALAALALTIATSAPNKLAAIVSPSLTQSKEIGVKCRMGALGLGEELDGDSATSLRFENGSRILSLPGTASSVRGWSADLLLVDEAAWVAEATWQAARPTTIATRGRIVVSSTPGLPVGWLHELWTASDADWLRIHVSSEDVPTISAADLERYRRELSEALYAQEYLGIFPGADALGAWFSEAEYEARINPAFPAINIDLEDI